MKIHNRKLLLALVDANNNVIKRIALQAQTEVIMRNFLMALMEIYFPEMKLSQVKTVSY